MRSLFCSLVLLLSCAAASAQKTEDAVKAAVTRLFTAMRNSDSAAIQACFTPEAVIQSISTDKDGQTAVKTTQVIAFASNVSHLEKNAADEQVIFSLIKVDEPLATVWTPFRFLLRQKFSHCGVNSIQLVKGSDGWKIQYLIYTKRKEGCPEGI
ncbi:nuclear transport factor 2 family protein [Chitinophaga nivalis]|uniref:Nuclear transport factor 2 family protein n=1 Tax=Chitinophaga nivalis TaxID=2991709 RepID=A0ABT3IWZ2_9BACT|nr:nuclear transport factor 2 family protein [Chitinophaga nivalis]MCW3461823.1 nuclear transport factor 2 family protein [Chitinophaga nivalis]MCW3488483.1 nuclear transport factor 2 family protein [Chitinophaga nivalis]